MKLAKKFENEHIKALEKLDQRADSPDSKVKMITNDLRCEKDRVYKLKEQVRTMEKNSQSKQEHMVKLEK